MIDVVRGATSAPVSTEKLIEELNRLNIADGILYVGYPIIAHIENKSSLDAILVSQEFGMVIFDIVEDPQVVNRTSLRDELFNIIHSKLITSPHLSERRGQLKVRINVITYAPAWSNISISNVGESLDEILVSSADFDRFFNQIKEKIDVQIYQRLLEVLQAITRLKHRPARKTLKESSKGAILNELEKSISNLDKQQNRAVIETVNGIQRIRGLAGSGKTIVLALKVAYLHSKYEDWNIGVTFYTRSLKNQFKDLITKFTIDHKNEPPDWTKIKIMQAWGSPKDEGMYYRFCVENNVEYYDFEGARFRYVGETDYLGACCEEAIRKVEKSKEVFDVILIDEAQDFTESFLVMCHRLLKPCDIDNNSNRRLIYAYDELQRLNDATSLRSPKEIFGSQIDFNFEPNKAKQDIILEKCYRNSAPVLVTAHGLGFGTARHKGLVTMFKEIELWKDIGYTVEQGRLEFGEQVVLKRDENTSPELLKGKVRLDDLITFEKFGNSQEQIRKIADQIENDLVNEELNPKDIIVIHPNPKLTKSATAPLRDLLFKKGIKSHLAGVTTSQDEFFMEDSVVFTSIYRAKGNEAAVVYIMDAHYCFDGLELIKKRNSLFTAITRSKGWVRVNGIGEDMNSLIQEFKCIKAGVNNKQFRLNFKYPLPEEMDRLNVIHRDLSETEKKSIEDANNDLINLINKLEMGLIKKEDLSDSQLNTLKSLINDNKTNI